MPPAARPRPAPVPADVRARTPLITTAAWRRLRDLREHPDAPTWNYVVGDRVVRADLRAVDALRTALAQPAPPGDGAPPPWLLAATAELCPRVPLYAAHLPARGPVDWAAIPTTCRDDLVLRLGDLVPRDADLSRLIVYDTSGTTGHALHIPHHPRAMAQNLALLEALLARHGVRFTPTARDVAGFNVGAHLSTVVFAAVFSAWHGAGFAKVNLHPRAWRADRARRYFRDQDPRLLTGDPLGFSELLAWDVDAAPVALVSSATTLAPALARALADRYRCPVLDSYATTETGVVAATAPDGRGLEVLPPDIYVEVVDETGHPLPEGVFGEICVTGGRNPYLPLLRYRTGDFARLVWHDASGAPSTPRLLDLAARTAVTFRAGDGAVVSPVDVGLIIRTYPVAQHAFVQRKDRACALVVRTVGGGPVDTIALAAELEALLAPGVRVAVRVDPTLGAAGKVAPFAVEGG